jgi:hypothetical protein
MTAEERAISFLNRFFVFRKMRNVNTEKMTKLLMKHHVDTPLNQDEDEDEDNKIAAVAVSTTTKTRKPRKLKEKMVLDKYSPVNQPSGIASDK